MGTDTCLRSCLRNYQQALAASTSRQEILEDEADAGAVASMVFADDAELELDEE